MLSVNFITPTNLCWHVIAFFLLVVEIGRKCSLDQIVSLEGIVEDSLKPEFLLL